MRNKLFALHLTIIALISFSALAQDKCSICKETLTKDIEIISREKNVFLHYLNIIDERTYNENNRQIDANINLLGISSNGDYNEMIKNIRNYFKKQNVDYSYQNSEQIVRSTTSSKGYESFDNCIKMCMGANGVFPYITMNTYNECKIDIKVHPMIREGVVLAYRVNKSNIENGVFDNKTTLWDNNKELNDDKTHSFYIRKLNPSYPTIIYLEVDGVNTALHVPVYKAPKIDVANKTFTLPESGKPQQAGNSDALCGTLRIANRKAKVTITVKLQATFSGGNKKTGFDMDFLVNGRAKNVLSDLIDGKTAEFTESFIVEKDEFGVINAKIRMNRIWMGGSVEGPTTINVIGGEDGTRIRIEELE